MVSEVTSFVSQLTEKPIVNLKLCQQNSEGDTPANSNGTCELNSRDLNESFLDSGTLGNLAD